MVEKLLPYPCRCGGKLKKSVTSVEFFGLDFGVRECEVCTGCGSEFLSDETMEGIEREVRKRQLFGLEKRVQITKSGNSLVIRIPPEIAKYAGVGYKDVVRIYPVEKHRLEVELQA